MYSYLRCLGLLLAYSYLRCLGLLLASCCMLLGCVTMPAQPDTTQPYARLVLPDTIRLLALDTRAFDARLRLTDLRVTPGTYRMRFAYAGPSAAHAGQQADPYMLEVQAGQQYVFEART